MTLTELIQEQVDKLQVDHRLLVEGADGESATFFYHPKYGVYLEKYTPIRHTVAESPNITITPNWCEATPESRL